MLTNDMRPELDRTAGDRAALERELLDEMTSWSSRDRGPAFKTWHRHALSLVHLNVLFELESEGPLSMRRLAEAMDVSDASATGIVDRMEKRGLVERRHDAEDRRVVLVDIADAGRRIFGDMADRRRELLANLLGQLNDTEMSALLIGMRAIHAATATAVADEPGTDAVASVDNAAQPPPAS
jgi:MarR family 2-MHQ and catechol resistance regulon transcriptional repressor